MREFGVMSVYSNLFINVVLGRARRHSADHSKVLSPSLPL